jgi:hypothetical protein
MAWSVARCARLSSWKAPKDRAPPNLRTDEDCSCGCQAPGREARRRPWRTVDYQAEGAGRAALQAKAREWVDLTPTIEELQAVDFRSLRAIAVALDERGIPAARGAVRWSAVQVAWLLQNAGLQPRPFEGSVAVA